jgi:iron complex transport system ATP-binding protein
LDVTAVIALHDLNLAAMFCDELVVLTGGRVVASGPPDAVLTEDLIAAVYGVGCVIGKDRGRPFIRFERPHSGGHRPVRR